MPRVFDNIDQSLLPALCQTLGISERADFCVGYFNLRGWKAIGSYIEPWPGGPGHACRLLVGMQRLPQDVLRDALSVVRHRNEIDNQTAIRLKKQLAAEFRDQLTVGMPTNEDEAGLRRLAAQMRSNETDGHFPGCPFLVTVDDRSAYFQNTKLSLIASDEHLGLGPVAAWLPLSRGRWAGPKRGESA